MQRDVIYWWAGKTFMVLILYNCRYHPDKNANDPQAADMFQEVTFSYNILSDPDKRRQYDTAGFEVRYAGILIGLLFGIQECYFCCFSCVSLFVPFLKLLYSSYFLFKISSGFTFSFSISFSSFM